MQDMLVPIFGDNGAIIVQYGITLVVIIALIALVVWGMRRYGSSAIRPAARGQLPRLAIVDALPVDNKRKLVLLRRDNVEHLILIGGPSDLVVEPSIVRQRVGQRPGQATASRPGASAAPQAATVAPQPAPAPPEPAAPAAVRSHDTPARASTESEASTDSTIHFPVRRTSTYAAVDRFSSSRRESGRGLAHASPAHAESARSYRAAPSTAGDTEPGQAAIRREPVTARHDLTATRVDPRPESRPEPASRFAPAAATGAVEPPDGPVPGYEPDDEDRAVASAFAPHGVEPVDDSDRAESDASAEEVEVEAASSAAASGEPAAATAADEDVGNLEQEMARLLDQISTTRRE